MTSWNERNKAVIEEFRTHGGKVKGWAPLMLLTTTGAKTGQTRIAPLMLVTDGDRLLAVDRGRMAGDVYASPGHGDVHVELGHALVAGQRVS